MTVCTDDNSLQPVAVSNATATVLANGTVYGANVVADLAWSEVYVSFPRTNVLPISFGLSRSVVYFVLTAYLLTTTDS